MYLFAFILVLDIFHSHLHICKFKDHLSLDQKLNIPLFSFVVMDSLLHCMAFIMKEERRGLLGHCILKFRSGGVISEQQKDKE